MTTPGDMYPRGYDRPVASAAVRLLNTIIALYAEDETPLPTRRYVSLGSLSAVDTDQLVVMFGGVYNGPPGNELTTPYPGDAGRSVSLNVELWRRQPALTASGGAPRPESIQTASEILMHDSWLLMESAGRFDLQGKGFIANVGVNEPQGEYASISMTIEAMIL